MANNISKLLSPSRGRVDIGTLLQQEQKPVAYQVADQQQRRDIVAGSWCMFQPFSLVTPQYNMDHYRSNGIPWYYH